MQHARLVTVAVSVGFFILSACADDDANLIDDASLGPSDDAAIDPDAALLHDAATDAGPQGPYGPLPTNVSFETARSIDTIGEGVLQPVQTYEQVDFYAFEADADVVYEITTSARRFSPNNVLQLFNADEQLVAENDIGWLWPGDEIDARLVVRLRESGTYYLRVEDVETPPTAFADDLSPVLFYHLLIREIDHETPGFVWAPDDASLVSELPFTGDFTAGVSYVTVLGELREGKTDSFRLLGRDGQALIGHVLPAGDHGNGSTAYGGKVRILNSEAHSVATIDRNSGAEQIHPPMTMEPYVLSIEADGELGDNSFYAINFVQLPENPLELSDTEEMRNDSLETAEVLNSTGMFTRRGTVIAQLPSGDVDYYSFEAAQGEIMRVLCEGASAGSGVVALTADIRDPDDESVAMQVEEIPLGVLIEDVVVEKTGTHYLRLSSDTPDDPELPPAWTRCAVIVTF